jgi:hypothetical protein
MSEIGEAAARKLDPAQATQLSLLVDLEAGWENMRRASADDAGAAAFLRNLLAKQKTYEAFRVKLAAYNGLYRPAHTPELLLNTPSRLAKWCRKMTDLYLRLAELDSQAHCPKHLLEKAYRWADLIGVRRKSELVSRAAQPATVQDAIRALEAVGRWCDRLESVAHQG